MSPKTILQKNPPRLALIFLIIVLGCSVFYQVSHFEFINPDDNHHVLKNPFIRRGISLENFRFAFRSHLIDKSVYAHEWHPMTTLSHQLAFSLFGNDPSFHHAFNVFIHLLNSALVFWVLSYWTRRRWESFAVSLFFLLHPIQAEAASWVMARKDLLCAFFALITLGLFKRFIERISVQTWVMIVTFYILSLLSKSVLFTFPIIIALMEAWLSKKYMYLPFFKAWIKTILSKKHLLLIAIGWIYLAYNLQFNVGMLDTSILDRFLRVFESYAFYIKQLFWPMNLSLYGPYPDPSVSIILSIIGFFILNLVTALFSYLSKSKPYLIVGWLWFVLSLVPAVIAQYPADRYVYFASIGFFICLVWGIRDIALSVFKKNTAPAFIVILLLAVLTPITYAQVQHWESTQSISKRALVHNPQNLDALAHLGKSYSEAGKIDEAMSYYAKSLEFKPDDVMALRSLGDLHYRKGDMANAIQLYERAVQNDPRNASTLFSLGNTYQRLGRLEDAAAKYREALKIDSMHLSAGNNLAATYFMMEKPDEALEEYRKVLDKNPYYTDAILGKATVHVQLNELPSAKSLIWGALRHDPSNAVMWFNLANLLVEDGDHDSIEYYLKAIELNPRLVDAYFNLANFYDTIGQKSKALEHYLKSIEIKPSYVKSHDKLGVLYARMDDLAASEKHYREAVKYDPLHVNGLFNLGNLMMKKGEVELAVEFFAHAHQILPDNALIYERLMKAKAIRDEQGIEVEPST